MLNLIYEIFVKTPCTDLTKHEKSCSIYDGIVTEVLRNGGTDADSKCSKMDRSGSRDTGWRRYRRIYIKRYYIYRSKIGTDQRSKTVYYSSGENDSKDAEDKNCGNSKRNTTSGKQLYF